MQTDPSAGSVVLVGSTSKVQVGVKKCLVVMQLVVTWVVIVWVEIQLVVTWAVIQLVVTWEVTWLVWLKLGVTLQIAHPKNVDQ